MTDGSHCIHCVVSSVVCLSAFSSACALLCEYMCSFLFLYLISAAEPLTCILSLNPSSLWFSSIMQSALATHLFSLHSTTTWQLSHFPVREVLARLFFSHEKYLFYILALWLLEQYKYDPDHIQHNVYIHCDFQLKAYIKKKKKKSEWGETEEEGEEEIHPPSILHTTYSNSPLSLTVLRKTQINGRIIQLNVLKTQLGTFKLSYYLYSSPPKTVQLSTGELN